MKNTGATVVAMTTDVLNLLPSLFTRFLPSSTPAVSYSRRESDTTNGDIKRNDVKVKSFIARSTLAPVAQYALN